MVSTHQKQKVAKDIDQAKKQGYWHEAGRRRYFQVHGRWPNGFDTQGQVITTAQDKKGYFSKDADGNIQTGQTKVEAETTPVKPQNQNPDKYVYEVNGNVQTASTLASIPSKAKGIINQQTNKIVTQAERVQLVRQNGQIYKKTNDSFEAYGKTKGEKVAVKVKAGEKIVASDLIDRGGMKLTGRNLNTIKQSAHHSYNTNELEKIKKKKSEKRKPSVLSLLDTTANKEFNNITKENLAVPNAVKKSQSYNYLMQTGRKLFDENLKGVKKVVNDKIESDAQYLYNRELRVNKRSEKSRKNIGVYDALKMDKSDSNLSFIGKFAGNFAYAVSLGGMETVDKIALTAQKAAFYLKVSAADKFNLLGNTNKIGYEYNKNLGRKAAISSLNPTTREGIANIATAAVSAGFIAYSNTYANPTFKTTGKLVGEQKINAHSSISYTKKGANLKNSAFTPKGKQTVTFSYKEQLSGVFNKLRGKTVDTSLTKLPDGTLIKTQQVGNTVFKTTTTKGALKSTVEKFVGGKLKLTRQIKTTKQGSGLLQIEKIGKMDKKANINRISKNTIAQEKQSAQIVKVNAKINKNQKIVGTGVQENYRVVVTKAGNAKKLTAETNTKAIKVNSNAKLPSLNDATHVHKTKVKGLTIDEGHLSISKGKPTHETFISINKKPKNTGIDLYENVVVGKAKTKQTFIQKPEVVTGFKDVSTFNAETTVVKNGGIGFKINPGSLVMNKRGSFGGYAKSPLETLYSPKVSVTTIETPKGSFKIILPEIQAGGSSSNGFYGLGVMGTQNKEESFKDNPLLSAKPNFDFKPREENKTFSERVHDAPYKIAQQQKPRLKTEPKAKAVPKAKSFSKSKSKTLVDVATNVITDVLTDTETVADVKYNKVTIPHKFSYKPVALSRLGLEETLPFIITSPMPQVDFNKGRKGFDVFVRKKGKFKQMNTGALSMGDAINFGTFETGNTSAASFQIRDSLSNISQTFNQKGKLADFDKKGNTYIEKLGKRITSSGEKQEITFKGLLAIKNKKNKKWL